MAKKTSAPSILIASYLEAEHVDRIRAVDKQVVVHYEPELLRPPRYPADHNGHPTTRTQKITNTKPQAKKKQTKLRLRPPHGSSILGSPRLTSRS